VIIRHDTIIRKFFTPLRLLFVSCLPNGQPIGVLSFSWTAVSPPTLPEIDQGHIAMSSAYTRNLNFN
jgi:hypothetical protein